MKIASKLVKSALAAVTVLSLAGCSSSGNTQTSASTAASSSDKAQEIVIGISPDYPPFDTLDDDKNLTGFDYDMGEWLFKWLNENGYNYDHTWKQMSFDTIVSAIQTDQVDLGISGFTYSEDRKVEWSDPYSGSKQVALVNADSDLKTTDDLKGKHLGAQMAATGADVAKEIDSNAEIVENMQNSIASLKAGQLDAVVLDEAVAKNYADTGEYKILDGSLLDEEQHIIAKEGNTELMDAVNKALKAFMESDDYKSLCDKWGVSPYNG